MMKASPLYRVLFLLLFAAIVSPAFSQIGPRTWQDHLGINSCNSVTRNGSTVYASYQNGVIFFDESELAPKELNKINGLSDIGVRLLRTNPYNKKVLVVYDNCNIDIIDEHRNITNYPNIKLKTLNGKKIINEVTFEKQFAYLACGFGIVVFDTEKLEVRDTYIIGPNASNLEVNQLALNDAFIFAATDIGMYRGDRSKILNNYQNWAYDTVGIMKGHFCGVQNVAGTIISAYCPSLEDNAFQEKDSAYVYKNGSWQSYRPFLNEGHTIRKMGPVNDTMFSLINLIGLEVRNIGTGQLQQNINAVNGVINYGSLKDAYIGKNYSGNIAYWLADSYFGLNRFYNYYEPPVKITLNGMNKSTVGNIDIFKGKVAISPSFIGNVGIGNYSREGINFYKSGEWSYMQCYEDGGEKVQDVTSVLFDRFDTSRVWTASWYYGVQQYKNGQLVKPSLTPTTSPIMSTYNGEPRCSGLSMDSKGNLWFASSDQKTLLNVIKKDGSYQNFTFPVTHGFARKTFVDRNDNVWILHERDGGLTFYKNVNFAQPQADVNYKWLSNAVGGGNLANNAVYSIAEDQDGRIWVGTAEGLSVIYNPTAILGGGDFDAQPIKIVQDGNVELLLGKETVTCIKVDGANNKWCGTYSGGIYCFSPDGQTQLYHFTAENSPLYSNTIIEINYNEVTGDLFIATEAGLQSFRGIIVAGERDYSNVYAYPNPVKPNYAGTVLIRGLVDESIVKITDESGNMVWEAKSAGGQIEWPVTTLANSRVTTGVYLVYASTTNGELKALTKILVVN